jgi:hypothetical protein
LKDLTGSFTAGLLFLAGCALMDAILVVLLRIDARREHHFRSWLWPASQSICFDALPQKN